MCVTASLSFLSLSLLSFFYIIIPDGGSLRFTLSLIQTSCFTLVGHWFFPFPVPAFFLFSGSCLFFFLFQMIFSPNRFNLFGVLTWEVAFSVVGDIVFFQMVASVRKVLN